MEVTFETAKLAKEKGFNEPSTHIYTIGFGGIKEDKTVRKFGNYEDNDKLLQPVTLSKGQLHLALAPTQSLLQKWLREVHDIDIIINTYRSQDNKWYKFFISEKSKDVLKSDDYKSYEDSLEDGLFEGLKRVEISAKTNKTEEK